MTGIRKATALLLLFIALLAPLAAQTAAQTRLERIMQTKVLRVGTPGDYRPFAILDKATGTYQGHDIDIANLLAADLGVKVEFVQTSWPKLQADYQADLFDLAVGGITRSLARMMWAEILPPYAPNGKVALVRAADKAKFTSLAAIDTAGTIVIVNPGGTNEKFVRANLKNAAIVVHPNNAEIPALIASGAGDVMITETYEAVVYSKLDPRLYGAFLDKPLTKTSFMGFLIQKDDPAFVRIMNFIWNDAKLRGDLDMIAATWLR